jgi:hypothetical protein
MKILTVAEICRGFAICVGHITPNDAYTFTKEETTGNGVFSQLGYCLEGYADLVDANENVVLELKGGNLYDFRDYYGKSYKMRTNSTESGTWFCINPLPATKIYNGVLLKENTVKTYKGDGAETVIICIDGKVEVNDKILESKNYVRLLKDKVANVKVQPGSVGLYFKYSGKDQG